MDLIEDQKYTYVLKKKMEYCKTVANRNAEYDLYACDKNKIKTDNIVHARHYDSTTLHVGNVLTEYYCNQYGCDKNIIDQSKRYYDTQKKNYFIFDFDETLTTKHFFGAFRYDFETYPDRMPTIDDAFITDFFGSPERLEAIKEMIKNIKLNNGIPMILSCGIRKNIIRLCKQVNIYIDENYVFGNNGISCIENKASFILDIITNGNIPFTDNKFEHGNIELIDMRGHNVFYTDDDIKGNDRIISILKSRSKFPTEYKYDNSPFLNKKTKSLGLPIQRISEIVIAFEKKSI